MACDGWGNGMDWMWIGRRVNGDRNRRDDRRDTTQ